MPKYKLSLEDLDSPVEKAYGIFSPVGPLRLCFALNQEPFFRFKRCPEDLYQDYRENRFFYTLFHFEDPIHEIEWKMVHNRSYRSETGDIGALELFQDQGLTEKNWLNTQEGFNFFLWFEGEKQKVSFLHEVERALVNCSSIESLKALKLKDLEKINKIQKYYHDL